MRKMTNWPLVLGLCVAGGCSAVDSNDEPLAEFEADIRFTSHGIPHIRSGTFKGAGYGAGYAFAEDNLCIMLEHAVTMRGERSLYFGPDLAYYAPFVVFNSDPDNPNQVNNLESDTYFRFNYAPERLAFVKSGASQDAKDLIAGFVRGFNRRLDEHIAAGDGPDCVEATWRQPLVEDDLYRRALNLTILESGDLFRSTIPSAKPPSQVSAALTDREAVQLLAASQMPEIGGSNAYAFGKEITENGKGMVFGNPHFPWTGTERQYAMHLTVGDEYDVFGSTLLGLPIPLLGWNSSMAWSITYSTDTRIALYALELDSENPLRYRSGTMYKDMIVHEVIVPLADGESVARKVYLTDFGPIMMGGPFQWTSSNAFAIWDFSVGNNRMMDTYLDVGRAENVRQVKEALDKNLGLQFSNLIAADAKGEAFYSNISVSANYSDDKLAACFVPPLGPILFKDFHIPVLRAEEACLPDQADDAIQPDAIPASKRPSLFRDDFVMNTNDSHWIVTQAPEARLEGFQKTIGFEKTTRGERTRASIKQVEDRLSGADGLPGTKMTMETMLEIFYSGRNRTAELIVDDLVADCKANSTVVLDEEFTVDLTTACAALENWDRRNHVDSQGAILFEAFTHALPATSKVDYAFVDEFWRVPFDPDNPLGTPYGIKALEPVRRALAQATKQLSDSGIAPDARYGDVFGRTLDGKHYPLPGGLQLFHAIAPSFVEGQGFNGVIDYGNSFIHLVSFDEDGPRAKFVLTYSQGTDSDSLHREDQFPMYVSGNWINMPFTSAEIEASAGYKLVQVSEN